MGDIKAIETRYQGYKFRSRTEARWAVFFDAIGLKWEYELEGFTLKDGTNYLPDFYIPDWEMYLEVKPTLPTEDEIRKLQGLDKEVAPKRWKCGRFLIGTPGRPRIYLTDKGWEFTGGIALSVGPKATGMGPVIEAFAMTAGGTNLDIWPIYFTQTDGAFFQVDRFPCDGFCKGELYSASLPKGYVRRLYVGDGVDYGHDDLIRAYDAARSARFEFGESGAS